MRKTMKKEKNYAFIDSQNLNLLVRHLGWKLDFRRFRIYLKEKYCEKAVIVSGGGDFHCLIKYLFQQNKLEKVVIPDMHNYSALLKKFATKLAFLNDLKEKLEYKNKKAPRKDETLKGSFRGNSDIKYSKFTLLVKPRMFPYYRLLLK